MVGMQYTMCCVQCVLGFGKSDRGGLAPVGGEVRTLVNRRHRCRRERERERERERHRYDSGACALCAW